MPKGRFECQACGQRLESAATPHTIEDCRAYDRAKQRAWLVRPYDAEWCALVHAPTRAMARSKLWGQVMEADEWNSIQALRQPLLDGKVPTRELLIAAGWPEEWEGEPIQVHQYVSFCDCPLCWACMMDARYGSFQ